MKVFEETTGSKKVIQKGSWITGKMGQNLSSIVIFAGVWVKCKYLVGEGTWTDFLGGGGSPQCWPCNPEPDPTIFCDWAGEILGAKAPF